MDRFIEFGVESVDLSGIILKSNMDRFIGQNGCIYDFANAI